MLVDIVGKGQKLQMAIWKAMIDGNRKPPDNAKLPSLKEVLEQEEEKNNKHKESIKNGSGTEKNV